jgi:hypothetical protein
MRLILTLFCLLTFTTSASAEGAWALWMMGAASPWDSVETLSTRELCMEALHQQAQAVEGSRSPKTRPLGRSSQPVLIRTFAGSASPTPWTRAGRRGSEGPSLTSLPRL